MAEKMVTVCDVCGQPANQSVTIHAGLRRLVKDLCGLHVAELIKGTRPVRRGRPRGSSSSARPAARKAKAAKKTPQAKRARKKQAAAA
jgi:hypothetical protein